jgi:hypothetical protein
MRFKGQLLLPGESGPGLKVKLDVAEHHLAVESDGGGLGAWPLEAVEVERLHGDLFALTVAGEALRFVADDTIGFAYSAVPAIEQVARRSRSRSGLRSVFGWLKGPDDSTPAVGVETPPAERPTPPVVEPSPRQDFLELEATDIKPQPAPQPEVILDPPVVDERFVPDPAEAPADPVLGPSAAEAVPDGAQCAGVRSDGHRCESQILTDSGYCYPHDPRRAFEDGYEAAQAARAQLKKDATARLNRIYARLDKAMRQVERGELEPETAMAMAQLARTMCAILEIDETADER